MQFPPGSGGLKGPLRLHGSIHERRIHRKQQEDARSAKLCADAQQMRWLQYKTDLCSRSDHLAEAADVRHRTEELRRTYASALLRRRAALQDLFVAEEEQYQEELRVLKGQPKRSREQLMERTSQLLKRREEEKKQVAQELRYKGWKQCGDELKSADSKLNTMQTLALRDEQLCHQANRERNEKLRERLFDALWLEDYRKKVQKEEDELQRRVTEELLTKTVRLQQVAVKEEQKRQEKEIVQVEHFQQRQQEAQRSADVRKEREAVQLRSLQRRQELDKAVAEQRKRIEIFREQTQEQDRYYLQQEEEKMRLEEQEELRKREAARHYAAGYKEAVRDEMQQKARERKEIDQLYLHEQEMEWQKKEAQLKHEENCRRRLMQEVEQSRNAFCRRRSQERQTEKEEKERCLELLKQDALALSEEIRTQKREKETAKQVYREELRKQLEQLRARRTELVKQDNKDYLDQLHMEKQMEEVLQAELEKRNQLLKAVAVRHLASTTL